MIRVYDRNIQISDNFIFYEWVVKIFKRFKSDNDRNMSDLSSLFICILYIFIRSLIFLNFEMKISFDEHFSTFNIFRSLVFSWLARGPIYHDFALTKFISHRKVHVHKGRKNKVREAHS